MSAAVSPWPTLEEGRQREGCFGGGVAIFFAGIGVELAQDEHACSRNACFIVSRAFGFHQT